MSHEDRSPERRLTGSRYAAVAWMRWSGGLQDVRMSREDTTAWTSVAYMEVGKGREHDRMDVGRLHGWRR
jgi:hypothetical protein